MLESFPSKGFVGGRREDVFSQLRTQTKCPSRMDVRSITDAEIGIENADCDGMSIPHYLRPPTRLLNPTSSCWLHFFTSPSCFTIPTNVPRALPVKKTVALSLQAA